MKHPLEDVKLCVFQGIDSQDGCVAFFGGDGTYPVYVRSDTVENVISKAEKLRAELIAKYYDTYVSRQKALEKARAARAKKEVT